MTTSTSEVFSRGVPVATAKDYPGIGYDLVAYFDTLHDFGTLAHTRETLAADGTVLLVEPYAGDTLAENTTPVGRMFYSASAMICTRGSLSQEVGAALSAQAAEATLRDGANGAGLGHYRRAAETPFNLILEARA